MTNLARITQLIFGAELPPYHLHKLCECDMQGQRLVGFLKCQVSFAKEPYSCMAFLQKTPNNVWCVLTVAKKTYFWGALLQKSHIKIGSFFKECPLKLVLLQERPENSKSLFNVATQYHTATHCNTLQHTATNCSTLQHTATHCNTLRHTATHCITLQHPFGSLFIVATPSVWSASQYEPKSKVMQVI